MRLAGKAKSAVPVVTGAGRRGGASWSMFHPAVLGGAQFSTRSGWGSGQSDEMREQLARAKRQMNDMARTTVKPSSSMQWLGMMGLGPGGDDEEPPSKPEPKSPRTDGTLADTLGLVHDQATSTYREEAYEPESELFEDTPNRSKISAAAVEAGENATPLPGSGAYVDNLVPQVNATLASGGLDANDRETRRLQASLKGVSEGGLSDTEAHASEVMTFGKSFFDSIKKGSFDTTKLAGAAGNMLLAMAEPEYADSDREHLRSKDPKVAAAHLRAIERLHKANKPLKDLT